MINCFTMLLVFVVLLAGATPTRAARVLTQPLPAPKRSASMLVPTASLRDRQLQAALPTVRSEVETRSVLDIEERPNNERFGDADDPAIWVDPTQPQRSVVICALKDGGLDVYDLHGDVIQSIASEPNKEQLRYNNVDLVYNFQLGDRPVDLVALTDRTNDLLVFYMINPATRKLENITAPGLPRVFTEGDYEALEEQTTAYGIALYKAPDRQVYAFVSQREYNLVAQLRLFDTGNGVAWERVRSLRFPLVDDDPAESQVEGMVADQELGHLYAGQEKYGIWKFDASPNGSSTGTIVDRVAPDGPHLQADVEGLTIYYAENGQGYLLASSQGDNTFVVYDRQRNEYIGNFQIDAQATRDSVQESDGADVVNVALGDDYPAGMLVVQDGSNDPAVLVEDDGELENVNSNFKFVRWDEVATAFSDALLIDSDGYHPRVSQIPPAPAPPSPSNALQLRLLGRYESGIYDESAAEIVAHDPGSQRLFVVKATAAAVDILDISNPSTPRKVGEIDASPYGAGVNSVAVRNGVIALAVENADLQQPGAAVFFSTTGQFLSSVTVGALPDMLTWTADGSKVLVANEGEPSSDYAIDPPGSVSVIDLAGGAQTLTDADVSTIGFADFNTDGPRAAELDQNIRIFGPDASVAQDLEPEYITLAPDGQRAWVALQENNAFAIINLVTNRVEQLVALGTKDHRVAGNSLDASDSDGAINITTQPVYGLYQPDAIAAYLANGATYILTANEGDSRDYDTYSEEASVAELVLDPASFPNAAELQDDAVLGRLIISTASGNTDADAAFEELYALGARSFSIRDAAGALVYDSGDDIEQITAAALPDDFNADHAENDSFDDRSDNKGPEPEGVVLGVVGGHTYAFVGLERIGGVVVYDVTDPRAPSFVQYINSRDFAGDPAVGSAGDLGPEGLTFIPANESPSRRALLVVGHEVSGSTAIYEINPRGGYLFLPSIERRN